MAQVQLASVFTSLLLLLSSRAFSAPLSGHPDDDAEVLDRNCAPGCTCDTGALSNLVMICEGLLETEDNNVLPRLMRAKKEIAVTRLDISASHLPILSDDFLNNERSYSASLKSLRISNSSVIKITSFAFLSARYLEEVELSYNDISFVPPEVFSLQQTPNLRLVSLTHNPQLNFPKRGAFLKSVSIQELDVSFCGVTDIHSHSLMRLSALTYVNLEGNLIETIHPDAFSRLNYLEEINLSGNQIVNLPSRLPRTLQTLNLRNNFRFNVSTLIDIAHDLEIKELDISACNIKELQRNNFLKLNDLTKLNISHNSIKHLYFPFVLRKLEYLDLSYNSLSGPMYENLLGSLSALETLSLAWNPGLQLPVEGFLGLLTTVYLLDLSGCGLQSISADNIIDFTGLVNLNLSHNALQTLPEDLFKNFPYLSTVDLSYNELNEIPNTIFNENSKLRRVSLASNPNLSPMLDPQLFATNTMLASLDISSCDLSDIPENLPNDIDTLLISDNNIRNSTKLSNTIRKSLYLLQTISLTENPWQCNAEFMELIDILRERQIIDYGIDSDGWSEYQAFVCVSNQRRLAEDLVRRANLMGQDVVRSHFWSLLTLSVTLMGFMLALGMAVACRRRRPSKKGLNYRQLSESSQVFNTNEAKTQHKIYREPSKLKLEGKLSKEISMSTPPETLFISTQSNLLFPRFPVQESEIPTSYVSGNYHHQELLP